MKRVYLAQIPYYFDTNVKYVFLPYSTGMIWSYACTHKEIRDNYNLEEMFFLKEPFDDIMTRIVDPDVVGLSLYTWNSNYTAKLAKKIKNKYPNTTIIVGGPQVPIRDNDNENFFQQHPYYDIGVLSEGELTFANVLLALHQKKDLKSVQGIIYNQNGKIYRTEKPTRTANLDVIPSPYLEGIFDPLLDYGRSKGYTINGLLETNRGCPYQCTFCDWGNGVLGKIKKFDLSRIKKELVWMGKNGIDYISACDANFGIFKERDIEVAEFMCKVKKRYGFPQIFDCNWPKNANSGTVEIAKLLFDNGLLRRWVNSVQSLNESTLQAIKRKNLPQDQFDEIMSHAESFGIVNNTDLIVGLPEETYQSFRDNFFKLIDQGVYASPVFTNILPNSEMATDDYKRRYGLKTRLISKHYAYSDEYEEVVVETSTMSETEMHRLFVLAWVVEQFHQTRYTNVICDFFITHYNWTTADFYEQFVDLLYLDEDVYPNKTLRNSITGDVGNLDIGQVNVPMHDELGHENRLQLFDDMFNLLWNILPNKEDSALLQDAVKLQNYTLVDTNREQISTFELQSNMFEYLSGASLSHGVNLYQVYHPGTNGLKFGHFIIKNRYEKNLTTIKPINQPFVWEDQDKNLLAVG